MKTTAIRNIVLGLCTTVLPLSAFAQDVAQNEATTEPKDWSLTLGAAAIVGPEYMGSEDTAVSGVPLIDFEYQDWFFASTRNGIGVKHSFTPNFLMGANIGYDFGREAETGTKLEGMGDIDGTVTAGLFSEFRVGYWKVSADIEADASGSGHEGLLGSMDLTWGTKFDNHMRFMIGGGATFMDTNYAKNLFGVTAVQSAASGNAVFDAGSGLRDIHSRATLIVPFSKNIAATVSVSYTHLQGDAQSSPIVEKESFVSGIIGASYRF